MSGSDGSGTKLSHLISTDLLGIRKYNIDSLHVVSHSWREATSFRVRGSLTRIKALRVTDT